MNRCGSDKVSASSEKIAKDMVFQKNKSIFAHKMYKLMRKKMKFL